MDCDDAMRELGMLCDEEALDPPRLVVVVDRAAWSALLPRVHRLWPYRVVRVPRAVALDDVAPTAEVVEGFLKPVVAAVDLASGLDPETRSEVIVVASEPEEWRIRTRSPTARVVRPEEVT